MIKKILKIVTYIFVVAAITALLGFAIDSNNKTICREFYVSILFDEDSFFVEPEDVKEAVYNAIGIIEGKSLSEIDLGKIESVINDMDFIQKAYVYRTISGVVNVIAKPRKPIVRVINSFNQSFYIDNKGKLMPFSRKYSPRVPVAFGNIRGVYSPVTNLEENDREMLSVNEKKLQDIYALASFINSNLFWKAFIDQIYITPSSHIELIPKGNIHVIEFGYVDDLENKFEKLEIFYTGGLTRVGWRNYSRINIKYSNQIICSK